MQQDFINGAIDQSHLGRKNDYLYRLSLKGVIVNDKGKVLVVKETGRGSWDIPGGGMDHGETLKDALAREMHEEVGLTGDFDYQIIAIEDPAYLKDANVLQVRLIFRITPSVMEFSPGIDGDEVSFIDPQVLRESPVLTERKVYEYTQLSLQI